MNLLYEYDAKDYEPEATPTYRYSSCGIVIRENEIAMAYIKEYGVYVIPGGGIEPGETKEQAVIREMREETGLVIIPESIREYGYTLCSRKGKHEPLYVVHDYYFLCDAEEEILQPEYTTSEEANGYSFSFVDAAYVLNENESRVSRGENPCLFKRDLAILERLVQDGLLKR